MIAKRSVGAGPQRSTEQVCVRLADFMAELLAARQVPDVADVTPRLEQLFPLFRLLLAKRISGDPAVVVTAGDLTVEVRVTYAVDDTEDLSVPSMDLLDPLTEQDHAEVTIFHTEEVGDRLRTLVSAASSERLRFGLATAKPIAGEAEPAPEPVPDIGIDKDTAVDSDTTTDAGNDHPQR